MDIKYVYEKGVDYCSCNIVIPIGTSSLPGLKVKFAHLIEHLIFHGHPLWGQNELLNYFENNGGIINASTEVEYTTIYFRIHVSKVVQALELILPAIVEFNINKECYDLEKKIISIEEKEFNDYFENVAIKKAIDNFYSLCCCNRIATYKEIIEIYKNYYNIGNWSIFVVGDLDKDIRNKISCNFKQYTNLRSTIDLKKISTSINKSKKDMFYGNLIFKSNEKYFAYIKSFNNVNVLSMRLYRNLIVNGLSSPLYCDLVSDNGFCYNVYSSNNLLSFGSSLLIFARYLGACKDIEEILIGNCGNIEKIKNMDDEEFIKAKEKTLCEFYLKCENIGQYAHMIVENYILTKKIITYKDLIKELSKMGINELRQTILNLYN